MLPPIRWDLKGPLENVLNLTTFRGSRIVVCRRLDALLTLGSAYSLLCAVNRCEKDTQSFSLRLQVIRPIFRQGGGRALTEVVKHRTRFRSKKQRTPNWCPCFLVAEVGFEPHDLRVMSPTSYQLLYPALLNLVQLWCR